MSLESLDHIVSGVLFDFAGFLTTSENELTVSKNHNVSPMLDAISEFMRLRGVDAESEPFFLWNSRCSLSDKTKCYKEIIKILTSILLNDSDLAWEWHSNIAMAFIDEGATIEQGNNVAARIMSRLFGIDTSTSILFTCPVGLPYKHKWNRDLNLQ